MKYLIILALFIAGCKADITPPFSTKSAGSSGQNSGAALTMRAGAFSGTQFGIYYNTNLDKVWAGQVLNAGCERMAITLSTYDGFEKIYQTLKDSGFGVACNVNYYSTGKTTPFVTDLTLYKTQLSALLGQYQPDVVVIENEEENEQYHTGPAQNYLNELKAAVTIGNNKGVAITNGGLDARMVVMSLYRDYIRRGQTDSAASLAARAIPSTMLRGLNNRGINPSLDSSLTFDSTLTAGYAKLAMAYVNIHYYEPIMYRNYSSAPGIIDTVASATPGVLVEIANYLTRITGKQIMCNEMGQLNTLPTLTSSTLQTAKDANLKYAIWYDSQNKNSHGATGLTKNPKLLATGASFKAFVSGQ